METRHRARLDVLLAALLFSTGGTLIKLTALDGCQVAWLRSLFGALTLFILIPAARRGWTWRTLLVAVAQASTLLLYVLGNKLTTAANMVFLQATAPLYLLLISPFLAFYLLGQEAPQGTAPDPGLGNALGALSGLTWALTVAGLRWLARTEAREGGSAVGAAAAAAALGNVLVVLACLPFGLPLASASPLDLGTVAFLGVIQIGVAYAFMTRGVRRVPAFEVSLLLLLEPVTSAILAWIVHGEVLGPWSMGGALLILVGTIAYAVQSGRTAAQAESASDSES